MLTKYMDQLTKHDLGSAIGGYLMAGVSRDGWRRFQSAATGISLIAVPIVVAMIGNEFNSATKEAEIRHRTVEIAVEILRSLPKEGEESALRGWAIDVMDEYSGVKLPDDAKAELQISQLPSPNNVVDLLTVGRIILDDSMDRARTGFGGILTNIEKTDESISFIYQSPIFPPGQIIMVFGSTIFIEGDNCLLNYGVNLNIKVIFWACATEYLQGNNLTVFN